MDGGDKTETMGLVISNEWNGTYTRHGPFFTHWEDCYIWAGVSVDMCVDVSVDVCVARRTVIFGQMQEARTCWDILSRTTT